MLSSYLLAIVSSLRLGELNSCIALIAVGFFYNELDGAENNFIIRNLVNAAGFLSFASGAVDVVSRKLDISLNSVAYTWFLVVGAILFSTVHSQEMTDQEGDSARGRRTVLLVLGDMRAMWKIAVPVFFWSYFCPHFLGLPAEGYLPCLLVGSTVAYSTVRQTVVSVQKTTFRIWNLWMVMIYLLPLMKRVSMEVG